MTNPRHRWASISTVTHALLYVQFLLLEIAPLAATVPVSSSCCRVSMYRIRRGTVRYLYGLQFDYAFAVTDMYLYAIDGTTGVLKWRYLSGGVIKRMPAIHPTDGSIIFGCEVRL